MTQIIERIQKLKNMTNSRISPSKANLSTMIMQADRNRNGNHSNNRPVDITELARHIRPFSPQNKRNISTLTSKNNGFRSQNGPSDRTANKNDRSIVQNIRNLKISGLSSPFERSNDSTRRPTLSNFSNKIKPNKTVIRNNEDNRNAYSRNKGLGESMSNPNKPIMSPSSNSSYSSTRNTSNMTNLGMRLKQKFGQNVTMNTPSRISMVPFLYKTFETNTDICAHEEDFRDLYSCELEFKSRISPLIDLEKLNVDVRENLICKIKKICDTYELSNEVFYNSVLLNDLQCMAKESRKTKEK